MPFLENHEKQFRLCVHHRDFRHVLHFNKECAGIILQSPHMRMQVNCDVIISPCSVGGFISHNILDGIEQSRRTIVLLSHNFLESQWCEFEFEHSQHRLLEDAEFKMIVILMEDSKQFNKIPR